jgi:DNA-binding NarL/FixJ family response regulator
MLTSFDDDDALFAAVMAGASGYLLKQVSGSSITDAIEEIAAGRSLIDSSLTGRLLQRLRAPDHEEESVDELTPREHEILMLITEGLTNRQIGERLFLAEKTVKHYVSGLLAKLGMQRRTQIAAYGSRLDLLDGSTNVRSARSDRAERHVPASPSHWSASAGHVAPATGDGPTLHRW